MKQIILWSSSLFLLFLLTAGALLYLPKLLKTDRETSEFRIGINRVNKAILRYETDKNAPVDSLSTLQSSSSFLFPGIVSLSSVRTNDSDKDALVKLFTEEAPYYVIKTELATYKLCYTFNATKKSTFSLIVILCLLVLYLVTLSFLYVLYHEILKPFRKLSSLPLELAKGNLTVPLTESKNKLFGRFLWGLNMLRETLEKGKERELALQREKKLLLLSLSHDIKTPLSAIKLYSSALQKNLYSSEEKKNSITKKINEKADEIDSYIGEIVSSSKEDFLEFSVTNTEFYKKEVLTRYTSFYQDRLKLQGTELLIEDSPDCLLKGDPDRLLEVLQNLTENAIKYGDGIRILLRVSSFPEGESFEVINSGPILPSSEFPHLFDSFYRGSNVNKQPGSGLGLFICRKLMHLMEGEIYADVETLSSSPAMAFHVLCKRC